MHRRQVRTGNAAPWTAWRVRLRHRCLWVAPSVGLILLTLTAARASDPERIELRYEIFGAAGVHVATSHTIMEKTVEQYAITTDVESRGIGALFVDLKSHSQVRGRMTLEGVRPQAYRGEVWRNGVESRFRVDYAANGAVVGEAMPPAETAKAVTPSLARGTVDQLTAFFMVERRLASRGSCLLDVAVYDGRRRYDLHFVDGAPEALPAIAERDFAGPTQTCQMRREAIAGFEDDSGRTEGAYEGKLWYARSPRGDLMVLVQMEFGTEFGTVTGHLAELHGRSIDLQLAE